ncbi:MAG: DUF11 domain-containing protein, partial [Myxococcales bacterium]|nr:DUF11 domain-containing protein [Myxococcales bacterium]
MLPRSARGFVAGQAPTPLQSVTLFGNAQAIGTTLMLPAPNSAEIRSVLLPSAASTLSGLPADAQIVAAYIFWSASLAQNGVPGPTVADPQVSFTTANGQTFNVNAGAGGCRTVVHPTFGTDFPPFYYCRADVTAQVAANPLAGSYNGIYTVGGVNASAATVDAAGNCIEPLPNRRCQAKYAAWSMVVIYRSPSETLQRDIRLYDGFLVLDHQDGAQGSTAQTTFNIGGFLADTNPQATLSYFAVETDSQLGVPPQNLLPPPLTCTTCQDFVRFNGTTLQDGSNQPGNIFNESTGNGTGVDIDTIDVSALIPGGSTSATITIGSGTGPVLNPAPAHGGGELFGYGWTLLTLRRPAPNFRTPATNKGVNPTQGGQGETVSYTVNITNAGSLPATNTVVVDNVPASMVYTPGTLQVGGTPCTDAIDGDPCSVVGGQIRVNLGTVSHLPGQNVRQISFLSTISPAATNGQVICNNAQVTSTETPVAHTTNNACVTVVAPQLGTATKVDLDLDGGVPEPDDIVQYQVVIRKQSAAAVSGLSFVDNVPADMQLLSVIAPTGATNNSTTVGGANGKGQINVTNITIPAGTQSVTVTYLLQVDSVAEFAARGVTADNINGRVVCNQGSVQAAFLPGPLATDDPAVPGGSDQTCFALVFTPNLSTSSKIGLDVNAGRLEPGDTVRYNITLNNSGNRPATINLTDDMPPATTGFTLITPTPGAIFTPAPAGANNTGQLTVNGLVIPAGGSRLISFDVTIIAAANDNQAVQNCATFTVAENAAQNRTICSATLNVFARPDLEVSRKTVLDGNGGNVVPGDTLTYTVTSRNDGNRPATAVVITDVVPATLENVVPAGGGTFNAATRTITWNVGAIAVGATATRTFTARVVVPTANGTQICNQANVASAEIPTEPTDNPDTPANDDPTCVTVVSAPDFSTTTKAVVDANGAPVRPGDTLTYSVVVRNSGTETGTNVQVVDVVDASLQNVTPLDGGIFNAATRTITWTVGALAPGATQTLRFTAQVITPLANGTTIDNQAFVRATQVPAPGTPSDDPSTAALDDPTRVTVVSAANLSTSQKTVVDQNGGAAQPGDVLAYTITVTNSGDAPARQTVVSDVVAATLNTVTPLDGGTFNAATRTITWPAATVLPGTPRVLRFSARVQFPLPSGTVVCNQGSITSSDVAGAVLTDDPNTAAVDDPTCLTIVSQPDLGGTTKTVVDANGGAFEPGDLVTYTIALNNIGTANANNVVVSDVVAATLTNVQPLDGGAFNAGTRTITWNVAQVPAGGTVNVRFTAQIVLPLDGGTQIANQATVITPGFPNVLTDDPNTPATDDPTIFTVTASPDFTTSTKAVTDQNGGVVEPGDLLTYTLRIVNSGRSNADQVVVSDVLDANLTFVSAQQGGTFNAASRTITWSGAATPQLVQLAPGAANAVTLTFTARVNTPLANGTQICNQGNIVSAEVTAAQRTDNPATPVAGDQTCVSVTSAPDLSNTSKTVVDNNGGPTRPGDTLTYTVTITNSGNAAANNVRVTDMVDVALTNVVVAQGGFFNPLTRLITWTAQSTPALASVAAGASVTLTFQAAVQLPLDNGTVISNQATVTSPDLAQNVLTDDPSTPAVDDPTRITVTSSTDVTTSTKTVLDTNGGDVVPGDVLTYTVTVINTGDALARNVEVTDVVAAQLTNVVPLDGGTFNAGTRVITWNVPLVGVGAAAAVQLRFRASVVTPLTNGTQIANQANIRVGGVGPQIPTDNPATPAVDDPTIVTVVSEPNLDNLQKTVAGTQPGRRATPGSTLTYTIRVTNTGTDVARNVRFSDVVDTNFENVTPLDGGTFNTATRTVSWSVSEIQPGQTVTVRFTARVRTDVVNGTVVDNQAFAERQGTTTRVPSDDPTTPAQDDPTRVTIEAIVDLEQFTKQVVDNNGGDAEPGDTLTYTLVVRNSGTASAIDVEVADALPPQLDNVVP